MQGESMAQASEPARQPPTADKRAPTPAAVATASKTAANTSNGDRLQLALAELDKCRAASRAAQEALITCVLAVIESGNRLQQCTQDLAQMVRQKSKADKRRAKTQRRTARQLKEVKPNGS